MGNIKKAEIKKAEEVHEQTNLSFNKRISLCKRYTFKYIVESHDLSEIADAKNNGYYSLKTIFSGLYPNLERYDLDLDLIIEPNKITGIWYDCLPESDLERHIPVDFEQLKEHPRLASMKNLVQSNGAIKSYTRRYALTTILGLSATDILENTYDGDNKQKPPKNEINNNNNDSVQTIIWWVLQNLTNKDKAKAKALLIKYTSFVGKDGKEISGVDDVRKLSGKRLDFTFKTLKKENPELVTKMSQEYDKRIEELKNKNNQQSVDKSVDKGVKSK